MDYRNDTEIWLYHAKRGGGHALVNWIGRNAGRPVFHLNTVFDKPWKVRWRGEKIFRKLLPSADDAVQRIFGLELDPATDFRELAAIHKDVLLCSLENFRLDRVPDEPLLTGDTETLLGRSRRRVTILVLRDAWNTFASVRKGKRRMRRRLKTFYSRYWKAYAREFLGETSYLPEDTVKIDFNSWFLDASYREEVARDLGLETADRGLDRVTGDGGGSSFTGQELQGQARDMDLLGRWRHFEDDPLYRSALDDETLELSERIFGDVTGGRIVASSRPTARPQAPGSG